MAKVTLTVTHADNEIAAFINGLVVYAAKQEKDTTLNAVTELDDYLVSGLNILTLVGVNWSEDAHYEGTLFIGNVGQPFSYTSKNAPVGISWIQTFTIPY
jgi:hypothetical protein